LNLISKEKGTKKKSRGGGESRAQGKNRNCLEVEETLLRDESEGPLRSCRGQGREGATAGDKNSKEPQLWKARETKKTGRGKRERPKGKL